MDIDQHTRNQANSLMWAQTKPMLWAVVGGALGLCAIGVAAGFIAGGGIAAFAAVFGAAFCGFKAWEAETELKLKAQRVQANIDSNEFAREFATAMHRSKTEGIDPAQALTGEFAQQVAFHQSALPQVASRSDGKLWKDVIPAVSTTAIQPKDILQHVTVTASNNLTSR